MYAVGVVVDDGRGSSPEGLHVKPRKNGAVVRALDTKLRAVASDKLTITYLHNDFFYHSEARKIHRTKLAAPRLACEACESRF